jgi:hypothetical protein
MSSAMSKGFSPMIALVWQMRARLRATDKLPWGSENLSWSFHRGIGWRAMVRQPD